MQLFCVVGKFLPANIFDLPSFISTNFKVRSILASKIINVNFKKSTKLEIFLILLDRKFMRVWTFHYE